MQRIFTLILLLLAMVSSLAQNTVKGVLYEDKSGEAIPFANVMIEGTTLGSATDINGFFLINKIPDGTYTLRVRYVGYEDYIQTVTLAKQQTLSLNIKLKTASTTMKDVVITTNRRQERMVQTSVSMEKLSAAQIQQMPSIGGQSDLAQYLQVLPGVNSTGDQGGQLYIRGGSMIQNLTLVDGMIVYNPFHSIGLYSIFETDVILNANIYTGGFGAEYGGRLSSIMDITTRDGNKKHHTGKVGLNTFGTNVILEGPLKRETEKSYSTVSYLLTAKNSFLSKSSTIFYPNIEGGLPFDFLDLYGKLSFNTGTGSKVNVFGFRYDDQVLGYQSIADFHWRNYGVGSNFVLVTGTSSVLDGTVAYSDYLVNLADASGKPKFSGINGFNANVNITNTYGNDKLKFGILFEGYSTKYHYVNQYNITQEQDENTTNASAYVTYHLITDRFLVDPGVRLTYYASLNEPTIEPRLSFKYNATPDLHIKFAGGFYSQVLLDARSDNDIVNLFSGFLTGSGELNTPNFFHGEPVTSCLQRAKHLVAGVEYDFTRHLSGNLEFYIKDFSQLVNMNHNQRYDQSDPAYQYGGVFEQPQYFLTDFVLQQGTAKGMDMSLCWDGDQIYLWATYSLGSVTRTDEIETYHPHYDRRHTVNLLATYTPGVERKWEFSARWSFGSGFPYTQTVGIFESLPFEDGISTDYWNSNGQYGVYYGEIYGGRLPAYHRLDLGVKRRFSFGRRTILDLNLSVTNVYNRNNIFYFDRLTFDRVDQLPILVCLGVNLSF